MGVNNKKTKQTFKNCSVKALQAKNTYSHQIYTSLRPSLRFDHMVDFAYLKWEIDECGVRSGHHLC